MSNQFDFSKRLGSKRIIQFANLLLDIAKQVGFKLSGRGWCYIMEQDGLINKNQFEKVENALSRCRKQGFLPVDFVAEESARDFENVIEKSDKTIKETLAWMLRDVIDGHKYFNPEYWEGEEYYIQVVVEKIDLKTLFSSVCSKYCIPIANGRGWSSILQRAEYCKRFKEAEEKGLKTVLLYCGDHDPDGLRISETLRKNLEQVSEIYWSGGAQGYDPSNLEIVRFGLNYDFIIKNGYTWIDNLITGNKSKTMDLSKPSHPNHRLPYVQRYLSTVGARKCEANAIVTTPDKGRDLMRETIESFLGKGAHERFQAKRDIVQEKYEELLTQYGINEIVQQVQDDMNEED